MLHGDTNKPKGALTCPIPVFLHDNNGHNFDSKAGLSTRGTKRGNTERKEERGGEEQREQHVGVVSLLLSPPQSVSRVLFPVVNVGWYDSLVVVVKGGRAGGRGSRELYTHT